MRKIKYVAGIVVILIILVFIGDMYVWNMESFETVYPCTTMYLPKGISQNEMIKDIEEKAEQFDCKLFVVNRNIESIFSETVTVYGMKGVEDYLEKESLIKKGNYDSILIGNAKLEMKYLQEIPDISQIEKFYIIGTIENATEFKRTLVDKYSGNFPKEGYVYFDAQKTIICVWATGILLLLLMTLFETVLLKKEMVVRFIYGESLKSIIRKRIFTDWIIYGLYFGIFGLLLKEMLNIQVNFHLEISILCLLLFGIIDAMIYMRLFFVNYKRALTVGKSDKTVLTISYLYKAFTMVVIVLVMSVGIELIGEGIEFNKQKAFFTEYKNYSYMSIVALQDEIDVTEQMALEFYEKQVKQGKSFSSVYLDKGILTQRSCLLMDSGTITYLKKQIPELKNREIGKEIYFIVPENDYENSVKDLEMLVEMYCGENQKYQIITYTKSVSCIGIAKQSNIESKIYKNPIIILNTDDEILKKYFNGVYITSATMLQIDKNNWKNYLDKHQVCEDVCYLTNVYDNYNYQLKSYKRNILLGVAAFLLLILMEIIIIRTTLYYECNIHATELTIKTVVGYSVFEKYKRLFVVTIASFLASVIICIIIAVILEVTSIVAIMLGYTAILIIDILFTLYYIKIMEKTSIQKILKGGAL